MSNRTTEEAANWLLRLENASTAEKQEFVDWVRESPRNLEEFLAVSAISSNLAACKWDAVEGIDALIESSPVNVIHFPGAGEAPQSARSAVKEVGQGTGEGRADRRSWALKSAIGCAAAVVLAAVTWLLSPGHAEYSTSIGEQRTVRLEDGSLMSMNARSRIVVTFSREERHVDLSGEASFEVAHDPKRPFTVTSGSIVAKAIGTHFNIRNMPSGTTVAVVEGTVGVTPIAQAGANQDADFSAGPYAAVLKAGQEAHLDQIGGIQSVAAVDPDTVLSWQRQFLVFRGNTIEDIVSEFNRWNSRQIRLIGVFDDKTLYDGVFKASDPQSLIDFLSLDKSIQIVSSTDEIIVRSYR